MVLRHLSVNDRPISPDERKFHWRLGRRPEDHPRLTLMDL